MPEGWTTGRFIEDDTIRIFSPEGVALPMMDGVGTDEQQLALAEYRALKTQELHERYQTVRARFDALPDPRTRRANGRT